MRPATANYGGSSASVLINDRSWPPAPENVPINDVTVTEGDSGTGAAVFTVTRSGQVPLAQKPEKLQCGIGVVDLRSGQTVAF